MKRMGKTAAMRQAVRDFTRKHPDAVIAYVSAGETRIEKPLKDARHRFIEPKRLGLSRSEKQP